MTYFLLFCLQDGTKLFKSTVVTGERSISNVAETFSKRIISGSNTIKEACIQLIIDSNCWSLFPGRGSSPTLSEGLFCLKCRQKGRIISRVFYCNCDKFYLRINAEKLARKFSKISGGNFPHLPPPSDLFPCRAFFNIQAGVPLVPPTKSHFAPPGKVPFP
jgi:hypothetical protein